MKHFLSNLRLDTGKLLGTVIFQGWWGPRLQRKNGSDNVSVMMEKLPEAVGSVVVPLEMGAELELSPFSFPKTFSNIPGLFLVLWEISE